MRVSVVSGVVCRIFTISADPVDTAEDMHAKGLGVSVACVGSVFVGVHACVRARVTVVCSSNHRLCVVDVITHFRTFFIIIEKHPTKSVDNINFVKILPGSIYIRRMLLSCTNTVDTDRGDLFY